MGVHCISLAALLSRLTLRSQGGAVAQTVRKMLKIKVEDKILCTRKSEQEQD